MRNDTYQVILYKTKSGWNATIAAVRTPSMGLDVFNNPVKTLKLARIKIESFYPVITWVSNKKAYLVAREDI